MIRLAKTLRKPHAEVTTGVDLHVPVILDYLRRNGNPFQGREVADIGSWDDFASHPVSIRLGPLKFRCLINPRLTLEQFRQEEEVPGNLD